MDTFLEKFLEVLTLWIIFGIFPMFVIGMGISLI